MKWLEDKSLRDYCGGALMFLLGIGAIVYGSTYRMGSLSRMGPGFFPVSLGVILALAGVAIGVRARFAGREGAAKVLPPEWRGWFCIAMSIVAFVVLGKYAGMLPATFAIVFISALGDRDNTLLSASVLGLGACVICVVVFWWALSMPFALFGPS
jgi:hypothetical protein